MITSVNNWGSKCKYMPMALLLKNLRVASQSYTKNKSLKTATPHQNCNRFTSSLKLSMNWLVESNSNSKSFAI